MTTYKFLLLLICGFIVSSNYSEAQQANDCMLRVTIEIQQSPGTQKYDRAVARVEGNKSEVKYVFYEVTKGDFLQLDFDKNYVEGLRKGSYVCIVAESEKDGCSKQVEFEIQ